MSVEAWELVFMMLVLKLPIAYLVGVVVWAIRATPDPYEPDALVRERPPALPDPPTPAPCSWHAHRRRTRAAHARSRTATVRAR